MPGDLTLLVLGAPILLSLGFGALFPRRPVVAGLVSAAILGGLLVGLNPANAAGGALLTTVTVCALAALPSILAAHLGARLRFIFSKEA